MIFETHAHYDDEQFDEDREQLLARLQEAGIETVVNVGATLEGCLSTIRLAEQYPFTVSYTHLTLPTNREV